MMLVKGIVKYVFQLMYKNQVQNYVIVHNFKLKVIVNKIKNVNGKIQNVKIKNVVKLIHLKLVYKIHHVLGIKINVVILQLAMIIKQILI